MASTAATAASSSMKPHLVFGHREDGLHHHLTEISTASKAQGSNEVKIREHKTWYLSLP
jgi:hypothetical protein